MIPDAVVPIEAYRRTDFIVRFAGTEIVARLDEPSPALDRVLADQHAASGTFITAWNPYSEQAPAAINHAANERMAARFAALGIRTLEHVGRAQEGEWFEEGFFALDLAPAAALAIARDFEQLAVVHVPAGRPAALLLTGLRPR